MTILEQINGYMPLKPSSVGDPDIYLGAKLKQTHLPNGVWAWGLSPSKYVAQAVKNCQSHLTKKIHDRYRPPTRADNLFPCDYAPEMDTTNPLDPECSSFYQHLIGVTRWMVELGRVDIATDISLLSSHLAYPREGHLDAALHVMGYLKQNHNSQLIFDPNYPDIDMSLTRPKSTLKKKCNSICYHAVRESVAMGESLITHISTGHNHSDLMTKVTSGAKRRRLVSGILYDIHDDHS